MFLCCGVVCARGVCACCVFCVLCVCVVERLQADVGLAFGEPWNELIN